MSIRSILVGLTSLTNANREFSARAATGVTHHLYRVGTWAKAAALYNELYRTNGIVRVST